MALQLVTAGESHGPALAAIVTGLPAGLTLDKRRDRRRPAPPPAGLRPQPAPEARVRRGGGALGPASRRDARDAAHARRPEPRPRELDVGDEPWPPEGEPERKGHQGRSRCPRPGHADLAGVLKYGHDDVRNALERASARHTAVHVAAGAVAKALLAELGITVEGRPVEVGGETTDEGMREATDAARKDRDTLGGIVEVVATGVPARARAPTRRRPTGSTRGSRSR